MQPTQARKSISVKRFRFDDDLVPKFHPPQPSLKPQQSLLTVPSPPEVSIFLNPQLQMLTPQHQGPVPSKDAEDYHGRDGIRDIKIAGDYYSTPLRKMIRKCLRVDRTRRPLSHELLGDVRETEDELDLPYEPLPHWALKKKRRGG